MYVYVKGSTFNKRMPQDAVRGTRAVRSSVLTPRHLTRRHHNDPHVFLHTSTTRETFSFPDRWPLPVRHFNSICNHSILSWNVSLFTMIVKKNTNLMKI